MNKSESKYFNTARLMDEAILLLLENKDLEFITVKEICKKAGVNRSTFYLHYENIEDLLSEAIEMINQRFNETFNNKVLKQIGALSKNDVIFMKPEYIAPYLNFVKENKKIFKIIHKKPYIFNNEKAFSKMYKETFEPILRKFNLPQNEAVYNFEFFSRGVVAIINKWVELDCVDSIDTMVEIILKCVNLNKITD